MPIDLDVIRGPYFADLLDQPRALAQTWEGLRNNSMLESIARSSRADRGKQVVLTGMGSSYFGLHPLSIELAAQGWTPVMLETSELVHYYKHLLTSSSLIIAVSQSGRSVEMLRMLEIRGRTAQLFAVTNDPQSPLAEKADAGVFTQAGAEHSVSCKTYVAAQMALSALGAALCQADLAARLDELRSAADAVENYLAGLEQHVLAFAELLRDTRDIFLVGRGPSLAAACTGALVIKESDHFHAEGISSAALRHGPFEMLQPGIFVGVFGGDEKTRGLHEGLLRDLARTPAKSALIASDAELPACRLPQVPAAARPIVEVLPVQMITLALAALRGRQPGKFDRATKVTAVE